MSQYQKHAGNDVPQKANHPKQWPITLQSPTNHTPITHQSLQLTSNAAAGLQHFVRICFARISSGPPRVIFCYATSLEASPRLPPPPAPTKSWHPPRQPQKHPPRQSWRPPRHPSGPSERHLGPPRYIIPGRDNWRAGMFNSCGVLPAQTWRKTSARILWGKGGDALRRPPFAPQKI